MKTITTIKLSNISLVTHDLSKYIKDLSPGDLVSFIDENNKDKFCNCIYFPKELNKYDINRQFKYYHKDHNEHIFLYHDVVKYSFSSSFGVYYYGYKLDEHNTEQKKKIEISLFL